MPKPKRRTDNAECHYNHANDPENACRTTRKTCGEKRYEDEPDGENVVAVDVHQERKTEKPRQDWPPTFASIEHAQENADDKTQAHHEKAVREHGWKDVGLWLPHVGRQAAQHQVPKRAEIQGNNRLAEPVPKKEPNSSTYYGDGERELDHKVVCG